MEGLGLDEMIKNAKIRASVLSGLDNRYAATTATAAYAAASGSGKATSIPQKRKRASDSVIPTARGGDSKDVMVAQLQDLLNDRSERIKNKLTDQLVGKSLVLEINKPTKSRATKLKRSEMYH
jgi:hypothetical protein